MGSAEQLSLEPSEEQSPETRSEALKRRHRSWVERNHKEDDLLPYLAAAAANAMFWVERGSHPITAAVGSAVAVALGKWLLEGDQRAVEIHKRALAIKKIRKKREQ